MIRVKSFLLLGAVLSISATAQAAKPHKEGQVTIGAERLFGFTRTSQHLKIEGNVDFDNTGTGFSLLNNPGAQARGQNGAPLVAPVFDVPRLGIDYFVADNIGVGGIVGLSTQSFTLSQDDTDNDLSATGLLFGLRGSYAYMFATKYGIWPRLGFTYLRSTVKYEPDTETVINPDTTTTIAMTALSIDVPLLILATPSFGFTVGPTLDTTLAGGMTVQGGLDSEELSVTEFGLMAGLVGLL